MAKVFIIWDNSNIHYGGLNQVFPIKEPNVAKEKYRTSFLNLLQLVKKDREIGQVYFVGSTPPKTDRIWNYLHSIGIEPETIPRADDGEWNTTDHLLQNHLLRLGYQPNPETVALLSGDGAGVKKNVGFFADLKRLANVGWRVELYSWEETCHKDLKSYATKVGKYINLTDYYDKITFIEGGRRSIALKMSII